MARTTKLGFVALKSESIEFASEHAVTPEAVVRREMNGMVHSPPVL
jgi:hypothetical protein